MFGRVIALVCVLVSSGVYATEPVPHQPTGKWVADFEDDGCYLSRTYGTEKAPLILTFEQEPMDSEIAVNVFKRSSRSDIVDGSGQLRFGSGKLLTGKSGAYTIRSGLRHILLNTDDASYASVANEDVISISVSGEVDEAFAIPGFAAAVQLLDQCAVDLGQHWGFTKEQQKSLAKPPEPLQPLHKYFDPSDYPEAALMRGATGRAKVRITVSETGRPTDCVLIKPSGDTALDAATCSVFMQSARFHPGLDSSGKPMRALIVENVSWSIG